MNAPIILVCGSRFWLIVAHPAASNKLGSLGLLRCLSCFGGHKFLSDFPYTDPTIEHVPLSYLLRGATASLPGRNFTVSIYIPNGIVLRAPDDTLSWNKTKCFGRPFAHSISYSSLPCLHRYIYVCGFRPTNTVLRDSLSRVSVSGGATHSPFSTSRNVNLIVSE